MKNVTPATRQFVFSICSIWAAIITSWAILQACVPLILKEIDEDSAATWQGVFFSSNALCAMIFCGLGGFYSDLMGRIELLKPWVLYFLTTTFAVVMGDYWKSVFPLWFARTAAIAIPSTIMHAFLSDFLSSDALLQSYGYVGATMGFALLTGSVACGVISFLLSRMAALCFSVLVAAVAVFLTFRFTTPSALLLSRGTEAEAVNKSAEEGEEDNGGSKKAFLRAIRLVVRDPMQRNIIIAAAIVRMANMNANMMMVLFINYRIGWGLSKISYLLGYAAFLAMGSQLFGVKFVIDHDIVFPALLISLLVMAIAMTAYCFVFSGFQLYLITTALSLASACGSIINARVTSVASLNGTAGFALGLVAVLHNLCEVFASLFFGRLLAWSVRRFPADSVAGGLPMALNGATVFVALAIFAVTHRWYGASGPSWSRMPATVDEDRDVEDT